MIQLDNVGFEQYKINLNKRGKVFTVETKRSEKHIVVFGKRVAKLKRNNTISFINKSKSKQMISLFGTVKKSINKYLVDSDLSIETIEKKHNSTKTNRPLFDSLELGSEFYYIDAKHCYWRIAFLSGYISEYYYNKVLENPDLKLSRNMALACIIAPKKIEYYGNGVMTHEIEEDNTIYSTIYNNIKFKTWNIFGGLYEELGKDNCMGYFTDGIMVFKEDLGKVRIELAKNKLLYKVIPCKKTADREYVQMDEGTLKRF